MARRETKNDKIAEREEKETTHTGMKLKTNGLDCNGIRQN